jgi:hypothetical protein
MIDPCLLGDRHALDEALLDVMDNEFSRGRIEKLNRAEVSLPIGLLSYAKRTVLACDGPNEQ